MEIGLEPASSFFQLDYLNDSSIYLYVVEYTNAVFLSVYDQTPRLGSLSVGYKQEDLLDSFNVFTGKHSAIADAIALRVVTKTNKTVYVSVVINDEEHLTLSIANDLLNQYLNHENAADPKA